MTDNTSINDLAEVLARPEPRLTHAGVHALCPTPGFEPPACEGVLALAWRRLDRTGDESRLIELYACDRCDRRVSLDATRGVILNDYAHQGAPR